MLDVLILLHPYTSKVGSRRVTVMEKLSLIKATRDNRFTNQEINKFEPKFVPASHTTRFVAMQNILQ